MSENAELIQKIVTELERRGETLSLAESCTGGLISAQVAELSGVSKVFLGAVVSYANRVKSEILDVPEELLQTFGAVSVQVASKMAEGARDKLHSDWALSVTGIAGPTGGSDYKPVGTVCFGLVGPMVAEGSGSVGSAPITEKQLFKGERTEIQAKSAQFALNLLWRHLVQSRDV